MLRPFLDVAAAWVPSPDINQGEATTHFGARAAERGFPSVPGDLLKWAVERAIAQGRDDITTLVWPICEKSTLYRIILPDGIAYPVIRGGVAVTIYTPAQVRVMRAARRARLAGSGRRMRRAKRK